jgi:hypothetical protein
MHDTAVLVRSKCRRGPQWQREVVALLRRDLKETSHHICVEDVDWRPWERLYLEGRSPHAAIDRVLERDL